MSDAPLKTSEILAVRAAKRAERAAAIVVDDELGPRVEYNPARVYIARLSSAHSRETMTRQLALVAGLRKSTIDAFPWASLGYAEVEALRAQLMDGRAHTTVNLALSAIRGVARVAFNLGRMDGEQLQRVLSIKNVRGHREPKGRVIELDELEAIRVAFQAIPGDYGALSRGLFAAFAGCGLRREEVAKLPLSAIRARSLYVVGKGNKERVIPIRNKTELALDEWFETRRAAGLDLPFMFVRVLPMIGTIENRPISIDVMGQVVKSWAGHVGKHFSPHDFRRSFVTHLLERGVDLLTVQRLAGHARPETTALYDRRGLRAAEKAIEEHGIY